MFIQLEDKIKPQEEAFVFDTKSYKKSFFIKYTLLTV